MALLVAFSNDTEQSFGKSIPVTDFAAILIIPAQSVLENGKLQAPSHLVMHILPAGTSQSFLSRAITGKIFILLAPIGDKDIQVLGAYAILGKPLGLVVKVGTGVEIGIRGRLLPVLD
jgi:hypothetical protein